jgi:hypothetical protein
MQHSGTLEISVTGLKGNQPLTPDNYDIREIISVIENAEALLYPNGGKERPMISYQIKEGSVTHSFKTSLHRIIELNAHLGELSRTQSIEFLEPKAKEAIETFQNLAIRYDYTFEITTSLHNTNQLRIDKTTHFHRSEALSVETEFYFYGKIISAGGKEKASIAIDDEELGIIKIQTPIDFLEHHSDNLLYKIVGIRATGKQNTETGEIDPSTLTFAELLDYAPKYDEPYLKALRDKAKTWLPGIDADAWLKEVRGEHGA